MESTAASRRTARHGGRRLLLPYGLTRSYAERYLPRGERFFVPGHGDLTPRDQLMQMVAKAFPVVQMEDYIDGDGKTRSVSARRGVIVSAGSINSPKLLQLSGIGPADLLKQHGIPVVYDRHSVGDNLRDHYTARHVYRVKNARSLNDVASGAPLREQRFGVLRVFDILVPIVRTCKKISQCWY